MPTYRNATGRDLYLNRPNAPGFLVGPTGEFEGSLYYRQFCRGFEEDPAKVMLEIIAGNTGVYVPTYVKDHVELVNKTKNYNLSSLTTAYSANRIDFREDDQLGREAFYVDLAVSTGAVDVQINDDAEITIASGGTEVFDVSQFVIVTIAFKTSASGTVAMTAGTVQNYL